MRKLLFFILIIFSFNFILFAELTKEQLYAISLTGIITERNRSNRNTLNVAEINEKNTDNWLTILKRDWGVNNREELLETLESTENNGHASALKTVKQIIQEASNNNNSISIFDIINKYQLNQRYYNYFKFTLLNWGLLSNRTILAWDLGRNISLCRWGYQVGFLTEEEAWQKIFYYARKIQLFYDSWEQYGSEYYIGRLFWASGFGDEINYALQTNPIYRKLINGYWKHIDWYTNLNSSPDDNGDIAISTIRYETPEDNDGILQLWTNDSRYYNKFLSHFMDNPGSDQNVYECRAKKMSGHENYAYGMLFCVGESNNENDTSYYRLFVAADGQFTVQKRINGSFVKAPISWNNSSFINTGYNVYNKLKVVRTDNNEAAAFNIYINDNLAGTFEDTEPLNGFRIGLVSSINVMEKEMFPHIPVDVRFDF